ncbi:hypothetical protein COO60DRAFT_99193 [Scenedesmus sp. NREL 46B-D3]|nr:hypothetical protein COO60DRAFT_99193 [Scenedesmus sp. NREL 46B-D3]
MAMLRTKSSGAFNAVWATACQIPTALVHQQSYKTAVALPQVLQQQTFTEQPPSGLCLGCTAPRGPSSKLYHKQRFTTTKGSATAQHALLYAQPVDAEAQDKQNIAYASTAEGADTAVDFAEVQVCEVSWQLVSCVSCCMLMQPHVPKRPDAKNPCCQGPQAKRSLNRHILRYEMNQMDCDVHHSMQNHMLLWAEYSQLC